MKVKEELGGVASGLRGRGYTSGAWTQPMPVVRVSEMTQDDSRVNDLELSDTFDGVVITFFPFVLTMPGIITSIKQLGQQGDQINQSERKSTLNIHRKDWS